MTGRSMTVERDIPCPFILNRDADEAHRPFLLKCAERILNMADPLKLTRKRVDKLGIRREITPGAFTIISVGKGALSMAGGALDGPGMEYEANGVVVAPGVLLSTGSGRTAAEMLRNNGMNVIGAEHPVPGPGSFEAGCAVLDAVSGCRGTCLFLLSGGASSLMEWNMERFPREDIAPLNRALVRSGADIDEMNVVRKHVSAIKGGRLAAAFGGRKMITLVMSDVMGSPPDVIGSGPTVPDSPGSTFGECRRILEKYGVNGSLSEAGRAFFSSGGKNAETPKVLACPERFTSDIIMSSELLVERLSDRLKEEEPGLGIRVIDPGELPSGAELKCEVVARRLADEFGTAANSVRQYADHEKEHQERTLVLFGGEPVVKVSGNGKGGRAQHTALLFLKYLLEDDGLAVWPLGSSMMAFATDGMDGNSGAAGCVVDDALFRRLTKCEGPVADDGPVDEKGKRRVLAKIEGYLGDLDSSGFFRELGAVIETGPTGTNVMDLYLMYVSGG